MTELTNRQIDAAWDSAPDRQGVARGRSLYDSARAVIAADRALQSARHAEELAAYELTVRNLRERTDTHAIASGAIYDFMGWLTTREERLVLSGNDEASPAAEAVAAFLTMRGVSKACEPAIANWSVDTAAPAPEPERKPMKAADIVALHKSIEPKATAISELMLRTIRAVEAFHGIKERGWNSGDLIASMMRDGAGS